MKAVVEHCLQVEQYVKFPCVSCTQQVDIKDHVNCVSLGNILIVLEK